MSGVVIVEGLGSEAKSKIPDRGIKKVDSGLGLRSTLAWGCLWCVGVDSGVDIRVRL